MLARHAVWQGLSAISVAGQRQKNAVEVKLDFPINYV
jgi:hypothetical protein